MEKAVLQQNILEIVASERSVHTLHILDQIKKMTLITKTTFDQNAVTEALKILQKKGLILHIEKIDSWKITETGKEEL